MKKLTAASFKFLSSFDGTPVTHFISELTHVLKELNNDENVCLCLLRRSFKGEAKFLFCEYLVKDQAKVHTASIEEWIDRLRLKFTQRFEDQYQEMKARKMESNESAHQYVFAITTLAASLEPQLPDMVSAKPPAEAAPEQQPNHSTTLMSAAINVMDHADGDADDRDAELAYDSDYAYDADDWCDPDYTFDTDHDMDQYEVDYYGAEGYDYYDDYDNCEYEY